MTWITLLFLAFAVTVMVVQYRASQTSAPIPTEQLAPVPAGGLEAIEYFWRPG